MSGVCEGCREHTGKTAETLGHKNQLQEAKFTVSIRRRTIKAPLGGYIWGAMLFGLSAEKVCKPEYIDAVYICSKLSGNFCVMGDIAPFCKNPYL